MDRPSFPSFCTSFRSVPPAGLWFLPDPHRHLIDSALSAVAETGLVMILSGDPGVGKTILARQIAHRCGSGQVAVIGQGRAQLLDLVHHLPQAFGLSPDPAFEDAETGTAALRTALRAKGGAALLIVDEAQALPDAGLDYLSRLITPSEGDGACLSVLLIDGGGLAARLAGHDGLRGRIGRRFHLVPFDQTQTADYIAHRFQVSGCSCHAGMQVFDDSALRHLHTLSAGVPRVIDTLVQRCLFQAGMTGRTVMDGSFVRSCLSALAEDGGLAHLVVLPTPRMPASAPAAAAPPLPPPARSPARDRMPHPDAKSVLSAYVPPATQARPANRHHRPDGRVTALAAGCAAAVVAAALILTPFPDRGRPTDAVSAAGLLPLAPVLAAARQAVADSDRPRQAVSRDDGLSTPLAGLVTPQSLPDADRLLNEGLAVGSADPERSAQLYARAALWGSDRAAYYLGQLYETGIGVAPDTQRAKAWYDQAAGLPGAAARLADLQGTSVAAPVAVPVPVAQIMITSGQTELHWAGHAPQFRIEYVPAGDGETIRNLETARSAILIPQPVIRWRVVALNGDGSDGPASPWSRLIITTR